MFSEVGGQERCGVVAKGYVAGLAAFAGQGNEGRGFEADIADGEVGELLGPRRGVVEGGEQGRVAAASPGGPLRIIRKYQARTGDPTLANADLHPHVLRHSKAMHLYEAGVPLPYIRDILGHVDLSTTEIYARASTEAKRKALQAVYADIVTDELPEWNQDTALLNWLATL